MLFCTPFSADGSSKVSPCPPRIATQIYAQNVEHFHLNMQANPLFERFMHKLALRVDEPLVVSTSGT